MDDSGDQPGSTAASMERLARWVACAEGLVAQIAFAGTDFETSQWLSAPVRSAHGALLDWMEVQTGSRTIAEPPTHLLAEPATNTDEGRALAARAHRALRIARDYQVSQWADSERELRQDFESLVRAVAAWVADRESVTSAEGAPSAGSPSEVTDSSHHDWVVLGTAPMSGQQADGWVQAPELTAVDEPLEVTFGPVICRRCLSSPADAGSTCAPPAPFATAHVWQSFLAASMTEAEALSFQDHEELTTPYPEVVTIVCLLCGQQADSGVDNCVGRRVGQSVDWDEFPRGAT